MTIDVVQAIRHSKGVTIAFRMVFIYIVEFRLLSAILSLIPVVIPPIQTRGCVAHQRAFRREFVPVFVDCMSLLDGGDILLSIVRLEEVHRLLTSTILLAFLRSQLTPALLVVIRAVVVTPAYVVLIPYAVKQSAILELINDIVSKLRAILEFMGKCLRVRAMDTSTGLPVKQVPVAIIQRDPTHVGLTILHVIMLSIHHMLAGIRCLADVDTVFVKLVVQARNRGIRISFNEVDTCQVLAVDVVAETALLNDPTILEALDERVGILEGRVSSCKPAAVLHHATRVGVGTVGI